MHRTNEFGRHWSFGITYTDNSIDLIEMFKNHCTDSKYINLYDNVSSKRNFDWFMTYLSELKEIRIETFYVENLRFIHHTDNLYQVAIYGLSYWSNGRRYFPLLCYEFGLGEAGSLPIPKDIIKIDINLTAEEGFKYLRNNVSIKGLISRYISSNSMKIEREVTIIIRVHNSSEYIATCLTTLFNQSVTDIEVVLIDENSTDDSIEIANRMSNLFNGRFKIYFGADKYDEAIQLSNGKYILLIDSSDILNNEALEFMLKIAEDTNSEFIISKMGGELQSFIIDNFENKIAVHLSMSPSIESCIQFLRRDLLINKKIHFSNNSLLIFNFKCLLLSQKTIYISGQLYINQIQKTIDKKISIKNDIFKMTKDLNELNDFMEELEYFKTHQKERLQVIINFVRVSMNNLTIKE